VKLAVRARWASRPEHRLLAAAAVPGARRTGDDAFDAGAIRWSYLVEVARRHRLDPLLSRWLDHDGRDCAPGPVVETLREARLGTSARNLFLQAELRRIATALAERGIPSLALKGAALVETTYGDASLRPMRDLDILVPEPDIARAEAAIHALGYLSTPWRPADELDGVRHGPRYAYPLLVRDRPPTGVDLHRRLAGDLPKLALDDFWERSRESDRGPYRVPSPEDLLLHAGIHFFKDRMVESTGSLGQLADVAWIVDRHELDWDALVRRASVYEVQGRLFLTLYSAREALGLRVPRGVMEELAPSAPMGILGRRFLARRVAGAAPWYPPHYFDAVPAERFSPRAGPLRRLFPSLDYLRLRYGRDEPHLGYVRLSARRVRGAARFLLTPRLLEDVVLSRWMRLLDAPRHR
jgi:hypothetical protein